jgi:hypothetical protein
VDAIEAIQSRLKGERARLDEMESDRARLGQARHVLAAVGLEPGDEAAEAEHAALRAERESLDRSLKGHATEKALAQQNHARLDEEARSLRGRLADAAGKLAAARARLEVLRDEAARARAAVPEDWRDLLDSATGTDIAAWDGEIQSLHARGLPTLAAELPQAHRLLGQAEADLGDLERQIAALPEEARRDPGEIAALALKAERALAQAEEDRRMRQGVLDKLRGDRDGRLDLESRKRAAEHELAVAETLARHLGPRGLQRELIRDAEHGIVALANPILREFSGGELELRLLDAGDDEPDHALRLEVNAPTA